MNVESLMQNASQIAIGVGLKILGALAAWTAGR
jgi:hypothetical protein